MAPAIQDMAKLVLIKLIIIDEWVGADLGNLGNHVGIRLLRSKCRLSINSRDLPNYLAGITPHELVDLPLSLLKRCN